MKVTQKHLQFLAQKRYPSLTNKINDGVKVSIHELIPNTNRQYKRELECEVHNTLMLLKSWRKRYSKRKFYIQLSQVIYNDQRPTTKHWRNRLFSKLIREYRNWKPISWLVNLASWFLLSVGKQNMRVVKKAFIFADLAVI